MAAAADSAARARMKWPPPPLPLPPACYAEHLDDERLDLIVTKSGRPTRLSGIWASALRSSRQREVVRRHEKLCERAADLGSIKALKRRVQHVESISTATNINEVTELDQQQPCKGAAELTQLAETTSEAALSCKEVFKDSEASLPSHRIASLLGEADGRSESTYASAMEDEVSQTSKCSVRSRSSLLDMISLSPSTQEHSFEHEDAQLLDAKEAYLWMSRSDAELLHNIEEILEDFDILSQECDELFCRCRASSTDCEAVVQGEETAEEPRVFPRHLRIATQSLIDRLGCRSSSVLERIGLIYQTANSSFGGIGLGPVEFRGYVASILTQIAHELEERETAPLDERSPR